jgi:hypothetical protein
MTTPSEAMSHKWCIPVELSPCALDAEIHLVRELLGVSQESGTIFVLVNAPDDARAGAELANAEDAILRALGDYGLDHAIVRPLRPLRWDEDRQRYVDPVETASASRDRWWRRDTAIRAHRERVDQVELSMLLLPAATVALWIYAGGSFSVVLWILAVAYPLLFLLRRRDKRLGAETADEILDSDKRPPILYLRAFDTDRSTLWYERRVRGALRKLGPLVAVGRPDDRRPLGHASRAYPRSDWKRFVLDLAKRAQLVVVRIGTAPNLCWELEQLVARESPEKLVLCLPKHPLISYRALRALFDEARTPKGQYAAFKGRVEHLFPGGLPSEVGRSTFVTFASDWKPLPSANLPGWRETNDRRTRYLRKLDRRLRWPRLIKFRLKL